eukprot:3565730-Amphidinium_carterae.1
MVAFIVIPRVAVSNEPDQKGHSDVHRSDQLVASCLNEMTRIAKLVEAQSSHISDLRAMIVATNNLL